jgi:hypothetical protein
MLCLLWQVDMCHCASSAHVPGISFGPHITEQRMWCSLTANLLNTTGRSPSPICVLSHYFLHWLTIDFLRVNMCTLATEQASQWLMVDPWEAFQSYQRTAIVLDHFDYEVNTVLGGAQLPSSPERRHIRPVLLAGSDLISTMSEPGVWSEMDVSP